MAARDLWFHNFKLKRTIFGEFFMCTFYSYRAWKSCVLIYLAAMCSNAVVCPERKKIQFFASRIKSEGFPTNWFPKMNILRKKNNAFALHIPWAFFCFGCDYDATKKYLIRYNFSFGDLLVFCVFACANKIICAKMSNDNIPQNRKPTKESR